MTTESEDLANKLAAELKKNRELTKKLYTLRGEAPPNDTTCAPASNPQQQRARPASDRPCAHIHPPQR